MDIDEYTRLDGLSLAEAITRGELSAAEAAILARSAAESVNDSLNAVVEFLDQPVSGKPIKGACFGGGTDVSKRSGCWNCGAETGKRVKSSARPGCPANGPLFPVYARRRSADYRSQYLP